MLNFLILASLAKYILWAHPAVLPYYFVLTTTIVNVPDAVLSVPDRSALETLDRSQNAIWLEHDWFQDGVTEEQRESLGEKLKQYEIRYVYPHLSPLDEDARLPAFSIEAARHFQRTLRRICPHVQILPWVGGVQVGFHQMHRGTVNLNSDSYLQRFAGECVYLTEHLGFDGIHLNIEPVDSGNVRFLEWLDHLKTQIGPHKILSVAAGKPSFFEGVNLSPLRSWSLSYYESVARNSDQMVIMNYDTGISGGFLYSLFVRERIGPILQRLQSAAIPCKVLLGVPTYDDAPHHHADAENISAAVKGLLPVLARRSERASFAGIALYAYWTTSEEEWKEFSDLWLRLMPGAPFP